MSTTLLVIFAVLAVPSAASACASCISSAFGDQTYNWAYLGLMLMPLVLCSVIGGVLAWRYRATMREARPNESTTTSLFHEETT